MELVLTYIGAVEGWFVEKNVEEHAIPMAETGDVIGEKAHAQTAVLGVVAEAQPASNTVAESNAQVEALRRTIEILRTWL